MKLISAAYTEMLKFKLNCDFLNVVFKCSKLVIAKF